MDEPQPHPAATLVYKFGGASVRDAAAIRNLARVVRDTAAGHPLLVVVSAMGKTTNALENLFGRAHAGQNYATELDDLVAFHRAIAADLGAVTPELESLLTALAEQLRAVEEGDFDRQYDQIVSFGELLATRIVADFLGGQWLDCRPLVRTDDNWREGRVDWPVTEGRIRAALAARLATGPVVVTQGFLGGTAAGATTTLGREGSDYSAAIFAYCLKAESVTIWKDVPGLLNADPKIFADTVLYPEISYAETIEMAFYGASVIHPKTIKPLAERRIPLYVRSFLDPVAPGTVIHDCQHPPLAPAFIRKAGQCLISFESTDFAFISEENLGVIFGALARARLKINLMQNSALSFSVCTDYSERRLGILLELLGGQFRMHYNSELALFTIKNYDAESIGSIVSGRKVLLEQRTRGTFQAVCAA